MAGTLAEKVWDAHLVRQGQERRTRSALHRPAPRARGHEPAGLRRSPARRPPGAPPRPHDRDRGPQHSDARHRPADRRPHQPHPDRDAAQQRRGVRRPPALARRRRAGHRARRRPAARTHACPASPWSAATRTPRRTARSARWRSASARARSSTCSPPRRCRCTPFKTMAITVEGQRCRPGVTAKDIILAVIAKIGTGGGQGYVLEYRGRPSARCRWKARMTICNMSIEAGARAGMVAPDETTFAYLEGRPHAPEGADWDAAVAYWRTLQTDDDAVFDAEVFLDATTSSRSSRGARTRARACRCRQRCPIPELIADENERARRRARARVHGPRRRARR